MNYFLTILLFFALIASAISGPPEPEAPLPPLEELIFLEGELESLQTLDPLREIIIEKRIMDKHLRAALEGVGESLKVIEISIDGDNISLTLSNDSIFVFSDLDSEYITRSGNDVLHVGGDTVVETDEIIHGDIISAFGDVTVKGTVDGSVLAFSGDIYISPTGTVRGSAVVLSGRIKLEPGGRILGEDFELSSTRISKFREKTPFKAMGFALLIAYIVWMILAATGAALFKKNVSVIVETVKSKTVASYFKGLLTYGLIFIAFLVLLITILGIPLAVLGVPVVALAGMILSFIAASMIAGQKITGVDESSFKTFLYGSLAIGLVPGLFFVTLILTGSLVVMIFSWIFVFLFLSVVIPFGLGAVLSTRFGIRTPNDRVTNQS